MKDKPWFDNAWAVAASGELFDGADPLDRKIFYGALHDTLYRLAAAVTPTPWGWYHSDNNG